MSETEILLKVLIIGDPNVGKTSFVQRYINNTFRGTYKWTIGVDFGLKLIQWSPTEAIKLQLWDIAGQERYTSMTRVYYKDAFGCVVMCDITQSHTFKSAALWKKDLDSKCTLSDSSPVPCILLANKDDLPIRSVSEKDLDAFCKEHNFLAWANTSVKENRMIKQSMKYLPIAINFQLTTQMASNYAQRMARLSARIFGEVVRPIPKKTNQLFRLFKDRPYNMDPHVVNYYPPIREINSLMLKLRTYGLFRDEHLDFKDEMKRLRILRGKTKPKKGEGKRSLKNK